MRRQRRTELCGAKTVADIVNSDAVSERSAKRVPPRACIITAPRTGNAAAI